MFLTVLRFHDFTRTLLELVIQAATVSAIGEETILYGPHGHFTCRQVWFVGGHWFFIEDGDGTLRERVQAAVAAQAPPPPAPDPTPLQ